MVGTTHDDKTMKVGITLPYSLINQTDKLVVTFQEAHISAEQSNIVLSKEKYGDGYCSGNHNIL
ncbi:MAG: hypothetical protein WBZ36_00300 [Candidatus Nitrosopolaris sp.]|jgi:hypothetical protein